MSAAGSSSQSTGTKRASSSAEDGPPKKKSGKAANGGGTLASYFTISPRPPPQLIASSAPFTDRRSTFVAHAAACTTQVGAAHFADHVRALRSDKHPREADHEMYAWRAVGLKPGKSGLSGEDDWTVKTGSEDDGEKGGGNTIRRAIEEAGGVDVVVVVSRYYGGIMLGPQRFSHIRLVTTQALEKLSEMQQLHELCARIAELDARILELTFKPGQPSRLTSAATYEQDKTMTLAKAGRLVRAREKRIDFLERHQMDGEATRSSRESPDGPEDTPSQINRHSGDEHDDDWEREAAEAFALAEAEDSARTGAGAADDLEDEDGQDG